MGRINDKGDVRSPNDPRVWTPHTRFVTLDDADVNREIESFRRSPSKYLLVLANIGYWVAALVIAACLLVHVIGLLVFFTPWYNVSIQVWIFRRLYSSFVSSDFNANLDAKRNAVAFVYLLMVGIVPTTLAASVWFALSGHRGLRLIVQTTSFLRHKPVFFAKWRPVYLDATLGQLMTSASFFTANAFIFIQVLLRSSTFMESPIEKIFRDVSRAFGYNAVFSMVWLLLFTIKASSWTLYLDFFSVRDTAKYLRWLGVSALAFSWLHGVSMAISFQIRGEFSARLFPMWSVVSKNPVVGTSVFGEIALAAMVVGALLAHWKYRMNVSLAIIGEMACGFVAIGAVCVHYPLAVAWLLPFLLLRLIQSAAAWTHTSAPVELLDIAPLPYGITRITIRRSFSEVIDGETNFTPGQFVYLNIPSVSRLQWYRCTIASSPERHYRQIKLYVSETSTASTSKRKLTDSWSTRVHSLAERAHRDNQPPVVHVDGFYGPTHSIYYEKHRCVVLVAKNKGIIQLLSMLEQLYHQAWRAKSEFFKRKGPHRFTALEDGEDLETCRHEARQVWLLWTIEDVCLFKEFEEIFFRIQALDPTEDYFRLRFFLTKIPTCEDMLHERVRACDFAEGSGRPQTPDEFRNDNPCRRAGRRPPQNHGGLGGWPSRPFQSALSGTWAKMTTLWLVLLASAPLAISGEWHSLNVKATGDWHALGSVFTFAIPLAIISALAGTISLLDDYVVSRRRRQRKRRAAAEHLIHRSEISTPRDPKRVPRVAARLDEANTGEERNSVPADAVLESAEVGPDIVDRFKIYTMKPDVAKFLSRVGRSFPRYAGRIGVFASGSESFIKHVEDSVIAGHARTGEWQHVDAAFDMHSQ